MGLTRKCQILIFTIIFLPALIVGIFYFRNRLTYLERTNFNTKDDTFYEIDSGDIELNQTFIAPYDMIRKVGIQINTFGRVNNSQWNISITAPSDGSVVCSKTISAALITDGEYYDINFDNKNHRIHKGKTYELHIRSLNANGNTGLGFYVSDSPVPGQVLYANSKAQAGSLCLKLYGGDTDYWWTGFFVIIMAWIAVMSGFYFKSGAEGLKTIRNSLILQGMLTAFIAFCLLMTFAGNNSFTDENDNIRGGMEIAKGAVLYRDYVTQHTPVTYYLCGIFALFGAGSIAQMRLSYYLVQSAVWGFLYYRHSAFWGRRKMLLLPILEIIFTISIIQPQGWMILSDSVQGICMVVLALEFIRYIYDQSLNLSRCIILSICIWGSFGSAFISAYALLFAFILFVIREIRLASGHKNTVRPFLKRYYRLILSVLVPPVLAVLYFSINNAFRLAFRLTYTFNTEIYSMYEDGLGTKKIQPLINAFQNLFSLIADNIGAVVQAQATNTQIIELIFVLAALAILIRLVLQKKYYEPAILFFLMCGNGTRGYDFHGLAAWYMILCIICVHYELLIPRWRRIWIPAAGCIAAFMLSIYVNTLGSNILTDQDAVSELETAAIEGTDSGDPILLDAYTCDTIYLLYKNRYPANRNVYFLPWYMNWYEQATIDDLKQYNPKIVIYNSDKTVWEEEYTHFTPAFLKSLEVNYARYSDNPDDGWKYYIWKRK